MDDLAVLRWYEVAGVDECVGETPVDRFAADAARAAAARAQPRDAPRPRTPPHPPPAVPRAAEGSAADPAAPAAAAARESAAAVAGRAETLDALRAALEAFDGCALKVTATTTVFGEGAADAALMVVGEAPGADEDRQGRPFCGVSGRLLDEMLASIGFDRSTAYITNVVPWRPPGNRKPTPAEVATCTPFIERHVALIAPRALLLVGGLAASTLIGTTEGITRLRGHWRTHRTPGDAPDVPAMPTFHPAYLLRNAEAKRLAWRDLLAVKARLAEG
nr:uracil-DNA glycosylase [Roseospira navarrensis]